MAREKLLPGRQKGSNQYQAKGVDFPTSEKAPATDRTKEASKRAKVGHDTYSKAKAIAKAAKRGQVKAETVEKLRSGEVSINAVATTLARAEKEKEREKRRRENAKAAAGVKDVREGGAKRATRLTGRAASRRLTRNRCPSWKTVKRQHGRILTHATLNVGWSEVQFNCAF